MPSSARRICVSSHPDATRKASRSARYLAPAVLPRFAIITAISSTTNRPRWRAFVTQELTELVASGSPSSIARPQRYRPHRQSIGSPGLVIEVLVREAGTEVRKPASAPGFPARIFAPRSSIQASAQLSSIACRTLSLWSIASLARPARSPTRGRYRPECRGPSSHRHMRRSAVRIYACRPPPSRRWLTRRAASAPGSRCTP